MNHLVTLHITSSLWVMLASLLQFIALIVSVVLVRQRPFLFLGTAVLTAALAGVIILGHLVRWS